MSCNIPGELDCEASGNLVRIFIDGLSTYWIGRDDSFFERIDEDNLNQELRIKHLKKEIQIKNTLDNGISLFKSQKYTKAIEKLDEVLFYDSEYGEALLFKSYCLCCQGHYVKALRHYRRAVRACESLKDIEYHKALLAKANDERSNFPKLKQNIYAGDEHFARGEYQMAIESYSRALQDSSRFKQKILSKLLNKKATAYLKLDDFTEALECFKESLDVERSDYAIFGRGICEYELDLDIDSGFRGFLEISKRQMLKQASVLKDLGYHEDSMRILKFLRENHFKNDEVYKKMAMLMD